MRHAAHTCSHISDSVDDQLAQSDARDSLNDGDVGKGPDQSAIAQALRAYPARHREKEEAKDSLTKADEENLLTKKPTKCPKVSNSEFQRKTDGALRSLHCVSDSLSPPDTRNARVSRGFVRSMRCDLFLLAVL